MNILQKSTFVVLLTTLSSSALLAPPDHVIVEVKEEVKENDLSFLESQDWQTVRNLSNAKIRKLLNKYPDVGLSTNVLYDLVLQWFNLDHKNNSLDLESPDARPFEKIEEVLNTLDEKKKPLVPVILKRTEFHSRLMQLAHCTRLDKLPSSKNSL